jgi:cell filamentation protein
MSYVLDDGRTLKNLLFVTDPDDLELVTTRLTGLRMLEIQTGLGPKPTLDLAYLKALHRHLFQDVFEWAGRTRNERIKLADDTIAHMPTMKKAGSAHSFAEGKQITSKLAVLFDGLHASAGLAGLSRTDFADQCADFLVELNNIHPFREGNGRTQRAFVTQLGKAAGHEIHFDVMSGERNIDVSITAHAGDNAAMRRLLQEITDLERVQALRTAQQFMDANGHRQWRDRYMSTTEGARTYRNATMVGKSGDHFLAHVDGTLLVGWRSDLPQPEPATRTTFDFLTVARL